MKLEIQIDTELTQNLENWTKKTLPQKRQQLVQDTLRSTLDETITHTPVDTGRTKAAWEAARDSLQTNELGDTAIGANTQSEGSTASQHDQDITTSTATNNVPYVSYLEYGTKNMSPFATLRNSLINIRTQLKNYFQI